MLAKKSSTSLISLLSFSPWQRSTQSCYGKNMSPATANPGGFCSLGFTFYYDRWGMDSIVFVYFFDPQTDSGQPSGLSPV